MNNWYKVAQGMKMIPTVKGRDFLKFLERLGYQFARQNGSHQIWKHPLTRQTVSVPIAAPKKQMDKGNIKSVMRQMGLSGQQFGNLYNSPENEQADIYQNQLVPVTASRSAFAQIQGEFWIDDSGNSIYADGDVGDYNHEGYVMSYVLSRYDLDWENNQIDVNSPQFIEDFVRQEWDDVVPFLVQEGLLDQDWVQDAYENPQGYYDLGIDNIAQTDVFKMKGMSEEEAEIASGQGDARLYAMKNWGWKRLQGNNVETWNLTSGDMSTIARGLWDAYNESAESGKFNVFVASNNKWFNDIDFLTLDSGKPGALRQHQFMGW